LTLTTFQHYFFPIVDDLTTDQVSTTFF